MIENYIVVLERDALLRTVTQTNKERSDATKKATELKNIIANVSHDLKTPLQGFTVGLESLQTVLTDVKSLAYKHDEKAQVDLAVCDESLLNLSTTAALMTMTINRSIDFTKAANGLALFPSIESVDLHRSIDWSVQCVRQSEFKVPVLLELHTVEVCRQIFTDKSWLQENLLCLISNGVRFSEVGAAVVRVCLDGVPPTAPTTTSSATNNNKHLGNIAVRKMLRFEVEDNGCGVPPHKVKGLFSTFDQAERYTGGTGLGLFSLAKRVEALQGDYGYSHRRDGQQGSLFWFRIPYDPDTTHVNSQPVRTAGEEMSDLLGIQIFDGKESEERELPFHVRSAGVQLQEATSPTTPSPAHMGLGLNQAASLTAAVTPSPSTARHGAIYPNSRKPTPTSSRWRDADRDMNSTMDLREEPKKFSNNHSYGSPAMKKFRVKQTFYVLVVDDSLPILKMTRNALVAEGHRVDTAENGSHEAVSLWEGERKQLIVGVSANCDGNTKEAAIIAGMDSFMAKPFTLTRFFDALVSLELVTVPHDPS
eukprot:gene1512-1752_t